MKDALVLPQHRHVLPTHESTSECTLSVVVGDRGGLEGSRKPTGAAIIKFITCPDNIAGYLRAIQLTNGAEDSKRDGFDGG